MRLSAGPAFETLGPAGGRADVGCVVHADDPRLAIDDADVLARAVARRLAPAASRALAHQVRDVDHPYRIALRVDRDALEHGTTADREPAVRLAAPELAPLAVAAMVDTVATEVVAALAGPAGAAVQGRTGHAPAHPCRTRPLRWRPLRRYVRLSKDKPRPGQNFGIASSATPGMSGKDPLNNCTICLKQLVSRSGSARRTLPSQKSLQKSSSKTATQAQLQGVSESTCSSQHPTHSRSILDVRWP